MKYIDISFRLCTFLNYLIKVSINKILGENNIDQVLIFIVISKIRVDVNMMTYDSVWSNRVVILVCIRTNQWKVMFT